MSETTIKSAGEEGPASAREVDLYLGSAWVGRFAHRRPVTTYSMGEVPPAPAFAVHFEAPEGSMVAVEVPRPVCETTVAAVTAPAGITGTWPLASLHGGQERAVTQEERWWGDGGTAPLAMVSVERVEFAAGDEG